MSSRDRIVRGYSLYEKLKEYKPSVVLAFDDNDGEIKINVPDVRQKHARVMTALEEVAWVRADLMDKKGGLLHRHMRCADDRPSVDAASELEDIGSGRSSSRLAIDLAPLVSIMLRAQEMALARNQQGIAQLLDAQNKFVDATLRRLDAQDQRYEHAMNMNHAMASDLVNLQLQLVAGDPEPVAEGQRPPTNSDRVMAMLFPQIMRAAMAPKDAPKDANPPTNGTPKDGAAPNGANGARKGPKSAPPTDGGGEQAAG